MKSSTSLRDLSRPSRWRLAVAALLLGHFAVQAAQAPIGFRYDLEPNSIGKLSEITDGSGVTRYSHDIYGHVTTKRQSLANGLVQQVNYDYSPKTGLLSRTTYPDGSVLAHGYDGTGRLIQLTWNGKPLVSNIRWNPMGQPLSWTWAFTSTGLSSNRVYDTAARLTATEFSSYVYDAAGRITSLAQNLYQPGDADPTRSTITSATRSWNVGYDATGRITAFNAAGSTSDTTSFRYDPNGNRLSSERTLDGQTTVRSYSVESGSNRIAGFTQARGSVTTSVSFRYNANGDMTGDGLRTYTYDAQRRLSAVTTGASDVSPTTRYANNALGQRVFKTEPLYPPAAGDESDPGFFQGLIGFFTKLWRPSASDAEKLGFAFMYNEGGSLIAETGMGGANSSGSTQHIYLPTRSGPMPIAAVINGSIYAVHSDHLNTPRRLTDSQGQPVWQWAYSAFGEEKPTIAKYRFANLDLTPNPGTTWNTEIVYNLGYPGQYRDSESGLSQNWNRYYDSRIGRYTQNDPIGLAGGWNPVSYANSNPLGYTDSTGLMPDCQWVANVLRCSTTPSLPGPEGIPSGPTDVPWPKLLPQPWVDSIKVACGNAFDRLKNWMLSVPPLPPDLVGDQSDPRAGPSKGGGRHTSGPLTPTNGGSGDFEADLDKLTGGTRPWQPGDKAPPGSLVGPNGIFGRPNSSGGRSIDIPANGSKPHETLHY
jgi:RHS repeat-associated protein